MPVCGRSKSTERSRAPEADRLGAASMRPARVLRLPDSESQGAAGQASRLSLLIPSFRLNQHSLQFWIVHHWICLPVLGSGFQGEYKILRDFRLGWFGQVQTFGSGISFFELAQSLLRFRHLQFAKPG